MMELENLIGKTAIDVVLSLPKMKWDFKKGEVNFKEVEISKLFFTQYETKKPLELKKEEDSFFYIEKKNLILRNIKNLLEKKDKRTGILSLAEINSSLQLSKNKIGHIPMIDIDMEDSYFRKLKEKERLEIIKTKLAFLGLEKEGLILSSSKNNYHFIGIGKLLDEEGLIDFLGNCLVKLRYEDPKGKIISLAHSAHIGHSLSPLGYVRRQSRRDNSSPGKRFITLRISSKDEKESLPRVIDIYEGLK